MIELADIVSIEEAGEETLDALERDNVYLLNLGYEEICVVGSYKEMKKTWIKYKKEVKEEENRASNFFIN